MEKAMSLGGLQKYRGSERRIIGLILLLLSTTSLYAQEQPKDDDTLQLRQNTFDKSIERPLDNYLNRLNQAAEVIEQEAASDRSVTPAQQPQTSAERVSDNFAVPEPRPVARDFAANSLEPQTIGSDLLEGGDEPTEGNDTAEADDNGSIITGATRNQSVQPIGGSTKPRNAIQVGSEAERIARERLANTGINPLKARGAGAELKTLPLDTNIVRRENNPYNATGIPVGLWRFRPTVSQGVEVTTNEGDTSTSSITTFTLSGIADWNDTQLNLESDLSITAPLDEGDAELEGAVNLNGTHTVSNALQAFGNVGYANNGASTTGGLDTEFATETTLQTFDISAGLRATGAKTQITGTIGAIHEAYDNAVTTTGVLLQDDRNNTVFSGALRLGYEVSPSLTPFAQVIVGRRMMANTKDALGFERSGYEIDATIGSEVDLGDKLRGEISAGWLGITYDDARLASWNSLALRGLLNWSPQRNTNLELAATSVVDAGSSATIGASTTYGLSATATHLFRDNLTGSAQLGYSFRDYANGADENLISARMDATYWFNRTFGLTGNISHQISDSAASGSQGATTLRLGVTVQR